MRYLRAEDADHDPVEVYDLSTRRAHPDGRPWLALNMIASLDGATSFGGHSGPLGGPTDRAVLGALRRAADVVLVGAGTVRAERYGPPRRQGLSIAVVSARLDLDWDSELLTSGRATVVTTEDAPEPPVPAAQVIRAGHGRVDLAAAVSELGRRGHRLVVCEGGARLNTGLVEAGLVDELCLTVAPLVVGGATAGLVAGAPEALRRMTLDQVATADDGYLFLRYLTPERSLSDASAPSPSPAG